MRIRRHSTAGVTAGLTAGTESGGRAEGVRGGFVFVRGSAFGGILTGGQPPTASPGPQAPMPSGSARRSDRTVRAGSPMSRSGSIRSGATMHLPQIP
jgi:hypothetical protein